MNSTILDCRTVAIVRDLQVEQRNGANGQFEVKNILFRIAVDRPYKLTRQENGKTISEYPTDFWLAKATGNVAQAINDYCTAKKEDGKLVSRRLLLSGNFENYESPRMAHGILPVVINGMQYNVEGDLPVKNNRETIFVVGEMKFLDSNPQNKTANGSTTATPVATATPVGQATPAQGQPIANGSTIPASQNTAPVNQAPAPQGTGATQATATATPATQAPTNNGVEGAMNVPTVGEGFTPTSQNAPF